MQWSLTMSRAFFLEKKIITKKENKQKYKQTAKTNQRRDLQKKWLIYPLFLESKKQTKQIIKKQPGSSMIPKYYNERKKKKTLKKILLLRPLQKKNFYMVCSIVSFPKKGRGTICLVSLEKKTTISTKNISDGCNHFHFLSAVKLLLLDILYISCGTIW